MVENGNGDLRLDDFDDASIAVLILDDVVFRTGQTGEVIVSIYDLFR